MATKLPKTAEPTTTLAAVPVKPPVTDVVKAAEPATAAPAITTPTVKTPVAAAARTTAKAIEAVAKPVVEAAKAPVAAVKQAARVAKVKTAPVRKAIVKATTPVVAPKPVIKPEPIIKKAAKAVVTAARTVAKPASKELTIMATMFETPKLFTDMNDRTKTAVESSQKFAAEMTEFSKGNVEAMVESTKIAAKGAENILKYTTDYGRSTVEAANASAKKFASIKSPAEFFQLQGDVAKSVVDAMVSESAKFTENYLKLMSEAAQPLSNRFALAAEKIKTAA